MMRRIEQMAAPQTGRRSGVREPLQEGAEKNGAATLFTISPDIYSFTDKDGSAILNVDRDRMYSVIGVGSAIWVKLASQPAGMTFDSIVESLSAEYQDVPRHQIEHDAERLLAGFQRNGFIRTGERRQDRFAAGWRDRGHAGFLFLARKATGLLLKFELYGLAAFLGLFVINIMLKFVSFSAFYHTVKRWPVSGGPGDHEAMAPVCVAVDKATTWYPKQAMCLQRSAVATCLLRSRGLPAQMVIGCRKIPFKSHAWAELYGLVVNDKEKVQEFYRVLDRC
jgi:transglutaminase superfamily protein/coenzyme PQQ synthesis protein D (PqqD)